MSAFYDRLLAEQTELNERKDKLNLFLASDNIHNIDPYQVCLLKIQAAAMQTYSQVLAERIEWLPKSA